MITSDNCSASVFVNSWFFLITLITTGKNECCFFPFFEYLISPWSSLGFWQLLCFMMRLQIQRWLMAFHIGKTFFARKKGTWLCEFLGKSSVQSGGGVLIQSLSKERARPQKRFFSALRASIWPKNTEGWSGSLLGGVSWNKGAIVKENMFYFGGVRENLSSSTIKLLTWTCWYWEEAEKNSRPSNSMTEPSRNYVCDTVIVVDTII